MYFTWDLIEDMYFTWDVIEEYAFYMRFDRRQQKLQLFHWFLEHMYNCRNMYLTWDVIEDNENDSYFVYLSVHAWVEVKCFCVFCKVDGK